MIPARGWRQAPRIVCGHNLLRKQPLFLPKPSGSTTTERRVIACALIRAYLEKYANNEFCPLAQIRISEVTPETHCMIEPGKQ